MLRKAALSISLGLLIPLLFPLALRAEESGFAVPEACGQLCLHPERCLTPPTPDAAEMDPRKWFVVFGLVNAYPKLGREQLIGDYFDPLMRALSPGFDGVNTFTDLRDQGLLLPPQIALGRSINKYIALSMHFGYSLGSVRTKESNPSLFFGLPLEVNFKIKRSAMYLGLDLDYYPFGAVALRDYQNWKERLRAARPALGTRLTWTDAGFAAKIKLGLKPFGDFLTIRLKESWLIPSVNFNVGVDIPVNRYSVLVFNAGYNFFKEEKGDFDGAAFTLGWRYFFE